MKTEGGNSSGIIPTSAVSSEFCSIGKIILSIGKLCRLKRSKYLRPLLEFTCVIDKVARHLLIKLQEGLDRIIRFPAGEKFFTHRTNILHFDTKHSIKPNISTHSRQWCISGGGITLQPPSTADIFTEMKHLDDAKMNLLINNDKLLHPPQTGGGDGGYNKFEQEFSSTYFGL